MGIENLSEVLSNTLADWFMVYGKCERCMIDDNGSLDAEGLDVSEAVPEHQCRRCFTDAMRRDIDQNIDPTIKLNFVQHAGNLKMNDKRLGLERRKRKITDESFILIASHTLCTLMGCGIGGVVACFSMMLMT